MYVIIVIVSIALLAVFLAATVAGGKAHDRQNAENARRDARRASEGDGGGEDTAYRE